MTRQWKSLDDFETPHGPNKRPDDALIYTVNAGGKGQQVLIKVGPALARTTGFEEQSRVSLRWSSGKAELAREPRSSRRLRQAKRWLVLSFAFKPEMGLPAVPATECRVVEAAPGKVVFELPKEQKK